MKNDVFSVTLPSCMSVLSRKVKHFILMPRLHHSNKLCNKLRATCCLKQHVAHNTQLVVGNKQLVARNMLLVACCRSLIFMNFSKRPVQ